MSEELKPCSGCAFFYNCAENNVDQSMRCDMYETSRQEAKPLTVAEIIADVKETSRMVQRDFNGRTGMYWDEWIENLDDTFSGDIHAALPPDQSARMPSREAVETVVADRIGDLDIVAEVTDRIMALFQGGGE